MFFWYDVYRVELEIKRNQALEQALNLKILKGSN